jgi:two-component system response regulator HydG
MSDALRVLVIDDQPAHADVVAETLQRIGYQCVIATSGAAGAKKIEQEDFDVILTDLRMPDMDGLGIVRKARQDQPDAEVIVITGYGDVRTAVEALKLGASHYLLKPVGMDELRAIVNKSAESSQLIRANRELKRQLDEKFGFEGVVGNTPRMKKLIEDLKKAAATSAIVLIRGENGTGKELVAHAIHANGPRKNKPFVAMNCSALAENLLDDELFGHEAGAFTGADRVRKGRFEFANNGTLFLDEVGDMPLALQAKLLRVLENGEVVRIGSNEPIKVNVRVVSATHKDLEAMCTAGEFRKDLYFRLKVLTIRLPPLRERLQDIPLLAAHFVKEFNQKHDKHVTGIAEPVRKAMAAYHWEGNVRELRNLIESMVVQDTDGMLNFDDYDEDNPLRRLSVPDRRDAGPNNLVGRPLEEVERYYIEKALAMTAGNREEAATMLGIGERTLYRKIVLWKQQDEVREALAHAGGKADEAAKVLGITEAELQDRIKKLGMQA